MKKIVILGASAACVKIIEEAKKVDAQTQITIIGFDGHYPYKRELFDKFMGKEIEPKQVFAADKDFYEKNGVTLVLDQKVSRINMKRKVVFLENKEQIEYDGLIISDTPENRFPEIKGKNKTGVFGYRKLKDVDQVAGLIPLVDTMALQSDSWTGLQAAAAIARRGKEAILVTSPNGFLVRHFDRDIQSWLIQELSQNQLKIIPDAAIEEILGDKDAKAIRIKNGKVYSTQAIVFVEYDEDIRLFGDLVEEGVAEIKVNERYQTTVEDVYAIDTVVSAFGVSAVNPIEELERQASLVTSAIFGGQAENVRKPWCQSLALENITIDVLGNVEQATSDELIWEFDQPTLAYRALIISGEKLKGAILINRKGDKERLMRIIGDEEPLGELLNESILSSEPIEEEISPESGIPEVSTELVDN